MNEPMPTAPPAAATFRFVHRETSETLTVSGIVWQTDDGGFHFQLDQHVPAWCTNETQADLRLTICGR